MVVPSDELGGQMGQGGPRDRSKRLADGIDELGQRHPTSAPVGFVLVHLTRYLGGKKRKVAEAVFGREVEGLQQRSGPHRIAALLRTLAGRGLLQRLARINRSDREYPGITLPPGGNEQYFIGAVRLLPIRHNAGFLPFDAAQLRIVFVSHEEP